ncbi:MAG TPA: pyridoxamine 5'-phosphate oxidase family protein, partial [Solirubrobacterales bacterium]|nr:pyridoxamine 5'-phosphate oxidase family protein [Solirubrobacterales bacterium]
KAQPRWGGGTVGRVRIDDSVRELLLGGTATIVASRDERMRPALGRGWGVEVAADGGKLTLCLAAAPGSAMRANLESNGAVAVTCSRPTTYRTVQVKGEAVRFAAPSEAQLAAVEEHVANFSHEVSAFGLPADVGRRLRDEELVAITILPREVFDQTPGAKAGSRL